MIKTILFLCSGNSCRSQIAEGIANKLLPHDIHIESASIEEHDINLNAIKVMNQIGISISHYSSKKIKYNNINNFDLVITLCGDAKDNCPVIKSKIHHIHWDIEEPVVYKGTTEQIENKFAEIRDIIFNNIKELKHIIKKDEIYS